MISLLGNNVEKLRLKIEILINISLGGHRISLVAVTKIEKNGEMLKSWKKYRKKK